MGQAFTIFKKALFFCYKEHSSIACRLFIKFKVIPIVQVSTCWRRKMNVLRVFNFQISQSE